VESQKRRHSPERSCLPTAATLPSEGTGISARPRLRPSDEPTAYLSLTGVAKGKDDCHLSMPQLLCFGERFSGRPARLPTAARTCAAISRRGARRTWHLPRLQRDTRERPRSPLAGLGSHPELHDVNQVAHPCGGETSSQTPAATHAMPAARAIHRPIGVTFSRRTSSDNSAIQSTFITPPTNSRAIRIQQQPTQ
jgi:hypothetical protein